MPRKTMRVITMAMMVAIGALLVIPLALQRHEYGMAGILGVITIVYVIVNIRMWKQLP